MSITPANLLEFAKAQCGHDDETTRRAALSRAYYCAYHSLVSSVADVPSVNSENNGDYISPREIIHRLNAWNVAKWPALNAQKVVALRMAVKFRILRDLRVRADYFLAADLPTETAILANERAAEIKTGAHQLTTAIKKAQDAGR